MSVDISARAPAPKGGVVTPALAHLAAAVAAALDDPAFLAAVEHHRRSPLTTLAAPLLNADAVAELLGLPVATVRQFARDGRLPHHRIGRHLRFLRVEVEQAALAGRLAS